MKSITTLQIIIIFITNIIQLRSENITAITLKNARKEFAEIAKVDTDFEPSDVSRVKSDEKWCEKFTLGANDEADIVQAMTRTLKWRKGYGVKNLTDDYFPQEIWKIGFVVDIGKAKSGQPVLLFRTNRWKRSPELLELMKRFIVYQMEKLDKQGKRQLVIIDFSAVSKLNIDVELYMHAALIGQLYYLYPNTLTFAPDMPALMKSTWKLIAFNEQIRQRLKYPSIDELTEYVDKAVLPPSLDGNNKKPLNPVPKSAKPLESITSYRFTAEQIEKIRKTFESELA